MPIYIPSSSKSTIPQRKADSNAITPNKIPSKKGDVTSASSVSATKVSTKQISSIPENTNMAIKKILASAGLKTGQHYLAKVLKILATPATTQPSLISNDSAFLAGSRDISPSHLKVGLQLLINGKILSVALNLLSSTALPKIGTSFKILVLPDLKLQAEPFRPALTLQLSKILATQTPLNEGIEQLLKFAKKTSSPESLQKLTKLLVLLLPKSPSTLREATGSSHKNRPTSNEKKELPPKPVKTTKSIKQILQQSGAFMEANLVKAARSKTSTSATFPKDIKALLIKILNTLEQENLSVRQSATTASNPGKNIEKTYTVSSQDPFLLTPFKFPSLLSKNPDIFQIENKELNTGQLLKLLAGLINRIQLHQLNSLYQSQPASPDLPQLQTWLLEIPFLNQNLIEPFQVRIDKEAKQQKSSAKKSSQSQWKITLAFDLQGLGPMFVQVSILPNGISSTIWAKETRTLKLLDKEKEHYRSQLEHLGVPVEDILFKKGEPELPKVTLEKRMVDVNA